MPLGNEQLDQQDATLQAIIALTEQVQSLRSEVAELRRAQNKRSELLDDVGPIGKEVMGAAMEQLNAQAKGLLHVRQRATGDRRPGRAELRR